MLPPPPPLSIPPQGTTVPPHRGGIDTIVNKQITAAYYAEFMTDQLLVVRRPRL